MLFLVVNHYKTYSRKKRSAERRPQCFLQNKTHRSQSKNAAPKTTHPMMAIHALNASIGNLLAPYNTRPALTGSQVLSHSVS